MLRKPRIGLEPHHPMKRTAVFGLVPTILSVLIMGSSCSKTTDEGAPAPEPSYTWWGTLIDSATGEGVGGLLVDVRERQAHIANGWDPYITSGIAANGRFDVTYYLRGVVPCTTFPETTLTLHLDFVDPAGRYAPRAHQSDAFIVCPRVLPPVEQLPLNFEGSVRVMLVRQ